MKEEKIIDALDMLDDELILEVERLRKVSTKSQKMKLKKGWGILIAACLCLVTVINGLDGSHSINHLSEKAGEKGEKQVDMIAFFIYQGNTYEQYEWIESDNLAGEYLGSATGRIDEWSETKSYEEFAGSIEGDFYEVQGIDPSFLLCMKHDDGSISTYMNTTGLALTRGSDLYENLLHLKGNYVEVQYQTREDWYHSNGQPQKLLEEHADKVARFVEGLNAGEFVEASSVLQKEIYHLFFEMENGMTVQLRLFENGFVSLRGMNDVCVKMEISRFNDLVQLLEEVQ